MAAVASQGDGAAMEKRGGGAGRGLKKASAATLAASCRPSHAHVIIHGAMTTVLSRYFFHSCVLFRFVLDDHHHLPPPPPPQPPPPPPPNRHLHATISETATNGSPIPRIMSAADDQWEGVADDRATLLGKEGTAQRSELPLERGGIASPEGEDGAAEAAADAAACKSARSFRAHMPQLTRCDVPSTSASCASPRHPPALPRLAPLLHRQVAAACPAP
jgi:hypothetical protein